MCVYEVELVPEGLKWNVRIRCKKGKNRISYNKSLNKKRRNNYMYLEEIALMSSSNWIQLVKGKISFA